MVPCSKRYSGGWFGDSSKILLQNSNERIIDEIKKLAPLIEEYNKNH